MCFCCVLMVYGTALSEYIMINGVHYALNHGLSGLKMLEFAAFESDRDAVDRVIFIAKQRCFANTGQCGISVTVHNA